ncbi:SCO2583/SCO2584 N-terminal domain-containing protein [Kitasatospora sp. McL0602]|uniref:SCO2583/SCO2584 N-terminal domain-containing protein n=1 Tax=Kitasatospora sp. McL0602 TaxID=3439530 RepID=UPI003F8C2271
MPIAEDPDARPAKEPEHDPFEGLVLDEDFVRAATEKEQSARARMLGARWRAQPPEAEQWRPPTEIRRRRFGRRAKVVDPWGRRKRRRSWQTPLFVVLAVAVTLAALNVGRLHSWYAVHFGTDSDTTTAAPSAAKPAAKPTHTAAPETAAPTAAPPAVADDTPTVDHPWAGSPAADWPAGASAIVLPQAQAVGAFDADQVATRLQLVKDYLIATNLDPAVIAGGSPQAALDLLNSKAQANLAAALAKHDKDDNPLGWLTRIAPQEAALVGSTVKVQGWTKLEGDGEDGLLVHTDYTFVYPVRPGTDSHPTGSTWTARVIERRAIDFRFYDPAHYRVDSNKIYMQHGSSDGAGAACNDDDGFLHPDFPKYTFGDSMPTAQGAPSDPYDHSKPLTVDPDAKCGTASRV